MRVEGRGLRFRIQGAGFKIQGVNLAFAGGSLDKPLPLERQV